MDPGRDEMAMVRFSVIAPCVNGVISAGSKAEYYRKVAETPVELPGGRLRTFSPNTFSYWEHAYRHGGFEALAADGRSDSGETRALTEEEQRRVESLRDEYPRLGPTGIRRKMVELGHMGDEDGASVSTFQRFFHRNPRRGDVGGDGKDRRAFEAEAPGDLWQGDTLHGPFCVIDPATGRRGKAYLQMLIDDRTRLITSGTFWANDNGVNFQRTLEGGIRMWGLPRALYLDHGGPYENKQLTGICGRLGIVLKHAPVRDGAAKGKVERNFRTVRSRFLAALPEDPDRTIDDLNDLLKKYITEHNSTPHSALGGATPMQAWDLLTEGAPVRRHKGDEWLRECLRNRETRRVNKDATVRIRNVLYDVPQHLVGQSVEFAFTPDDPDDCWVVDERGNRAKVAPTDKQANGRTPREAPRYHVDYTKGGRK